ncbi:hypothetical protein D3C81_570020 [compost metagenome]
MSSVSLGLLGFFIGMPLIIILVWLIYMVHVYTEKAEALLSNSGFVKANLEAFDQAGLLGKAMRNGFITLVLINPDLLAKRGLVNVNEVKEFPRRIKRVSVVSWGLCFLFTSALMILGFYIEYVDKSAGV